MRWEKLQPVLRLTQNGARETSEGSGPGKRWGHTCNAVKGGQVIYVFGGFGKNNCQTNEIHVFDIARQTWSEPVIKGTPPTPRDSHSCSTVGDNLFVFGGTDGMKPLKDLHILETSSHTWISPSVRGEGPEAREGHSAAVVGNRIYIFGGCGKSANTCTEVYYNDLYILNTDTFEWQRALTSGTPPSPRDSHTCSAWNNKIVVIGGEDGTGSYLSDVYILDTETLVWNVLDTCGKLPPRAGHSTVTFGKNLFVFGGFSDEQNLYDDLHMLDLETRLWAKVTATGDEPSARFSVAGVGLDPQRDGVLVFVGGCNMHLEALGDMYYLHTGLGRENGSYVQDNRGVEKFAWKHQARVKPIEQEHSPSLPHHSGMNTDTFQPMPAPISGQTSMPNIQPEGSEHPEGKRKFNAKVTDILPGGYAIETIIDGKLLRGVIFSNKTNSSKTVNENSKRKRAPKTAHGVKLRDDSHTKSDNVHGNESQTEAVAASVLQNFTPSNAIHPQGQVPANSSTEPAVNVDDAVMYDAPISFAEVGEENITATASVSAVPYQDGGEATTEEQNLPVNQSGTDVSPVGSGM